MKKLLKSSIIFLSIGLLLLSCKKDDDDSSGGGAAAQTTYLTVTKSGTVYQNGSESVNTAGGDAVEFTSVYSSSPFTAAELAFSSIPSVGNHAASLERGFSFSKDTEAWFSVSATTISIEVHDQSTNYVSGTVSGSMQSFSGSSTSSISAEFGFFY